jgi:hypothetical protein
MMDNRSTLSAFAHRAVRPRQAAQLVLYSAGVALLLVVVAAWIVGEATAQPPPVDTMYPGWVPLPWDTVALADIFALILLALALFVIAPAAVAASLAGERRAGTLDQLRTTPASPLGLLGGIIVGAPLRLYLLCTGPLALHVIATLTGRVPPTVLVGSLFILGAGALLSVLFGAVLALAPQRDSGGALLALAAAGLSGFAGIITTGMGTSASSARWAFLHPGGALSSLMLSFDGLWQRMMLSPWRLEQLHSSEWSAALSLAPLVSVALSLVLAALFAHAACRKLASPERPLFGKLSAVAVFTVLAAAIVLPVAQRDAYSARSATSITLALGIVLLPLLAMLTAFSTPTPEAFALAVRRGQRRGPFSDVAGPQGAAWLMIVLFLGLCTVSYGALGFLGGANGRDLLAVAWAITVAGTLPLFILFGALRFQTAGSRAAFHAATFAHVVFQMIGIGITREWSRSQVELSVVEVAALLGVVVPLVVAVLLARRIAALRLSAKRA